MKTSEMIAMLEKNPNLRFKAQNWTDASVVTFLDKRLSIIDSWNGNRLLDKTVLDCFRLHYDWQLVREPVTWQEAIQAMIEGKNVLCKCANCTGGIVLKTNPASQCVYPADGNICINAFKSGTWYIDHE